MSLNLKKLFGGSDKALPKGLREKLHTDWFGPLKKIPRGVNAYGPRCGEGSKGYLPWPPQLVRAYNAVEWETSRELLDGSFLTYKVFVPAFVNTEIGPEVYRHSWTVEKPDGSEDVIDLNDFWPAIIPKRAESGWIKLDPEFRCSWGGQPDKWYRWYARDGMRLDFELYYNYGPYAGRNPE